MIDEKEIELNGRKFILSKFPATVGREIISKYPISAMPKLGDYAVNEQTMFKLMTYVQVDLGNGNKQALTTRELIDNHTKDWETCVKLEWEMLRYNCSFFQNGEASTFFEGILQKAQQLIIKTLMDSSAQLSQKGAQPGTN